MAEMDTEARLSKVEADIAAIKFDVALIKATGATKVDLAEAKTELHSAIGAAKTELEGKIGETNTKIEAAKTSVIMWVVTAIFLAQLLPALLRFLGS
jgi:formate hydrogenlyase subunit 4